MSSKSNDELFAFYNPSWYNNLKIEGVRYTLPLQQQPLNLRQTHLVSKPLPQIKSFTQLYYAFSFAKVDGSLPRLPTLCYEKEHQPKGKYLPYIWCFIARRP